MATPGPSLLPVALKAFRKRVGYRQAYVRPTHWLLSYYDSLLRAAAGRVKLPLWGRTAEVLMAGASTPVTVRLGSSDWAVLEEVLLRHIYQSALELELGQPPTIVDLGANVGMTVRLWGDRWPQANIVAVEPDADNFRILRRNTTALPAERLRLVQAAVSSRPGVGSLDRDHDECAYRLTEAADESGGDSIEVLDVPTLLELADIRGDVDLMKCDIEGAEAQLFADCRGWIGRVKHLLVEAHAPYGVAQLENDLTRNGYRFGRLAVEPPQSDVVLLRRE